MRQVLSISLPIEDLRLAKRQAKQKGFDTLSGYIKHLLRVDKNIITEKELLKAKKEAEEEYRLGTAIEADSMADLL